MAEQIVLLGKTSFRNQEKRFGIKPDDRRRHIYIIGKTGMGKTVLMENMVVQDIRKGYGAAFVDPHGEAAEGLLNYVPTKRINDVVYFNPSDIDHPIAFNVMEQVDFRFRHLVASGLMGVFKKVWPDVWSARMEYILNNAILALLEYPDATLLGINRMLADVEYREKVVAKLTDPVVKSFWVTEYARYTQRYEIEATAAIQNKVGQFVSNPLIRNIIGQVKSTIDMRKIMDEGKILILNLSKGRIGEDNSKLLGALLITKMQLAAMSRVDIPEEERKDFYLYVDEFQNFATESFAGILSEARKYRLNLTLAHQYITQMEEEVRDAVFGNVGTIITFRIGAEDAEFLEREFTPDFLATDLVGLGKYNVYLKLMIDGVASRPFSADTLPPQEQEKESNVEKIIKASRERYGVKREIVEDKIRRWTGFSENSEGVLIQEGSVQSPGRAAGTFLSAAGPQRPQIQLFDAVCSNCSKPTKVVFEPTKGRPIYCKNCLKKMHPVKSAEGNVQPAARQSNVVKSAYQGQGETTPSVPAKQEFRRAENIPIKSERAEKPQSIPVVSLREALGKEVVSFAQPRKKIEKEKPKRREIDLSELRKALEESLDKPEKPKENIIQESKDEGNPEQVKVSVNENGNSSRQAGLSDRQAGKTNKGVLKPGEKVKF